MSDIAKNIKKLRQKKKLTQEELAEKLYVTRQAVSNWETGKNQPDIETLKSMAEVLGTDINELLYGPAPDENQRQKIVIATILCVLTVVAWLFYFPLLEWAKIRKGAYFEVIWSFLCGLGLKPLAFLLTGAAISAVLAVWTNIPPIKENLRRGFLFLGFVICLVHIWLTLGMFGVLPLGKVFVRFFDRVWSKNQWVFLFSGLFLFYGWPRKAG